MCECVCCYLSPSPSLPWGLLTQEVARLEVKHPQIHGARQTLGQLNLAPQANSTGAETERSEVNISTLTLTPLGLTREQRSTSVP